MAGAKQTGYVRTIDGMGGPAFYVKLKLPDGSQPQRRLGRGVNEAHAPARGLPDTRDD